MRTYKIAAGGTILKVPSAAIFNILDRHSLRYKTEVSFQNSSGLGH